MILKSRTVSLQDPLSTPSLLHLAAPTTFQYRWASTLNNFTEMLKTIILVAVLVLLLALTVNMSCIAEENTTYSLMCTLDGNVDSLRWITTKNNQTVRDIRTCFPKTTCKCSPGFPVFNGYNAILSCGDTLTSNLTIESVSRLSTLNDGITWTCLTLLRGGAEKERHHECDPLFIYAKPENVTCSRQELKSGDTELSITCVTNKVFPPAKCQLYNHNESHPLTSSITYSNQSTKTDPEYFHSTCTVNIEVSTLGVGQHQLFVKMFPNGTDDINKAGRDSDIISANLSDPQFEVSSSCFNGSNVKGKFIKTGTVSSCTCTMTNTGNPPGQIQWYRQGNSAPIGSLLSDRSVRFTITEENTTADQDYYCQLTSALTENQQTETFTREFAYGPDRVYLTGPNEFNICPGEEENITVICSVPEEAVNPNTNFKMFTENTKYIIIYGNKTEQVKGGNFSYTHTFRPNGGGLLNLTCEAENSEFNDLTKTAWHNVSVKAPPKDAPVIKITNKEKEMEISGSIIQIIEGEPVTVSCHVDEGYPPAIVTLNCSSLNESSVAKTVASLTSVRFTRETDNQTCICIATHVSGCYQHNQTSVWLNVSLSLVAEPLSDGNTGLDAAAIGGGIGAAVIVIVLVILVICVLKRKGFLRDKKNQNELMLNQVPCEDKEVETVTDNDLYGTRPKSEEIVTENDLYGTRPKSEEIVIENDIYGTGSGSGSVLKNDARDYSSFTPSITSAATVPGNLKASNSNSDHKEHVTENPYSDVAMPSTQPKPAVSAKPKTAIKPKTKYNNVNVSGEGAGPGFVIQGDNENQTYASVLKPAKAVSVRPGPKPTSNNDEINGNFYPDQSKKPDIPEKKFLKVEKDAENEKKQMEEKTAPVYEDAGFPTTSDSNTSYINDGFTGVEDETSVCSNTGTKGDGKDSKDKKGTGRYKNKDGLVYTQVDIGNQPGGQKTSRKPKIVEEGVNYTTLKFDEK